MEPSVGQESSHEDKGHGFERYYECEFCKRGFNTAQALGGHMNIHRKHRFKNKRPANASHNQLQVGAKSSCNAVVSSYDHHRFKNLGDSTSHVMSYATCLPGGSGSSSIHKEPVDHCLSSRLEAKDDHVLEKSTQVCMLNGEELDLELRLGYC